MRRLVHGLAHRDADGFYRRMVWIDDKPYIQVCSPEEAMQGSASWARTAAERAALADLERER